MKKKFLKKLSLSKLTISKLDDSDKVVGGSGICGTDSRPLNNCPPPPSCLRTQCMSCVPKSHQVNGC